MSRFMLWHFHTYVSFFCSNLIPQNLEGVIRKGRFSRSWSPPFTMLSVPYASSQGQILHMKVFISFFFSDYLRSEWLSYRFLRQSLEVCCVLRMLVEVYKFPPRERSVWMLNPTDNVTVFLLGFQMSCDKTCCSLLINSYKFRTLVAWTL